MINVIKLIQEKTIKDIADKLVTSSVVALKQLDKVVTGKTANSMTSEFERDENSIEISIIGGESLGYIIDGKPANTKLPVEKKGDKFELVQELKDWKAIRGVDIPDFVLAQSIAKNKRDGIDVASKTLNVFNQQFKNKITKGLLTFSAQEVAKDIKKETENGTSDN